MLTSKEELKLQLYIEMINSEIAGYEEFALTLGDYQWLALKLKEVNADLKDILNNQCTDNCLQHLKWERERNAK